MQKLLSLVGVFAWASILLTVAAFVNSHSVDELTEQFRALTESRNGVTFCSLICLAIALRGVRWLLFFSNGVKEDGAAHFFYHGWFSVLSMLSAFRSGEVLRLAWLQRHGLSLGAATTSVVTEKVSDAAFLGLALIFLSIVGLVGSAVSPVVSLFVGVVATALITLIFWRLYRLRVRLRASGEGAFLTGVRNMDRAMRDYLAEMQAGTRVPLHSNGTALLLMNTAAIWLIVIAAFHSLIGLNFGTVSLVTTAIMVISINILGFLNAFPANIGPFEATVMAVLMANNVEMEAAAAFAISTHFLVIMTTIAYGVACRLAISAQRAIK